MSLVLGFSPSIGNRKTHNCIDDRYGHETNIRSRNTLGCPTR